MCIIGKQAYNFIDLFAGAGGLSEGFLQAGFRPIAHVEMNEFAAKTLETRSAYYYLKGTDNLALYKKYVSGKISRDDYMKQIPASITKTIINETMSDETLPAIFKTIDGIMKIRGITKIDVIVGGPPCQAYSLVGRAQSSHMEVPMAEDPRNYLYKLYARFLKRYQPRMFVFENVTGIESANGGATWKNIQKYLKRVGYEIECREQNAHTFGVLQNRRRMTTLCSLIRCRIWQISYSSGMRFAFGSTVSMQKTALLTSLSFAMSRRRMYRSSSQPWRI